MPSTSPGNTGLGLREQPPQPNPSDVGALAGFGLRLDDPPLRGSVYVFADWNEGAVVGEQLRELVDGGSYRAVSTISGAVPLLFAVSEEPGEHGEQALAGLCRCSTPRGDRLGVRPRSPRSLRTSRRSKPLSANVSRCRDHP